MSTSERDAVTAGPPLTVAVVELLAAAALLAAVVPAGPLGRLLLLCAAVLVLVRGLRDLLLRPTLRATPQGLSLVDGLRRLDVPWAQVEQIRVVTDRRAQLLEVDLGDAVVVLSRSRLGAAPYLIREQLEELRPR